MKEFPIDAFRLFQDGWALVTCGTPEHYNTMTISWGSLGTLWNKPVATVYIKPIRYTYQFMETNEYFTISFFPPEYKKDLAILGSKSGKDLNKVALTALTPIACTHGMTFQEAKATLVCKKIYHQDLDLEAISGEAVERFYTEEAPHRMYIGEVTEVL